MRIILLLILFLSFCTVTIGQGFSNTEWYSESNTNGIILQNSFPRGGPYTGPTEKNFNYTHLVFFTRVVNETSRPITLKVNFTADSIPIPGVPDTYVKLFLPPDIMTAEKQSTFDYGVGDLASFEVPTQFQRTIGPNEECLFNVVALYYQTVATAENRQRGGNRAEFVLNGQDLYFRLPSTIDSLYCGQIISK